MYGILFCFGLLFAAGAYFILAGLLKLPTLAATQAVIQAGRTDSAKQRALTPWCWSFPTACPKFIHLDPYKRRKTEATLKSAGIPLTPETFTAKAALKAGLAAIGIIPAFLIFPS